MQAVHTLEKKINVTNLTASLPRAVITGCLLLLLAACASKPDRSIDSAIRDAVENQTAAAADQGTETPEYYINLASSAQGEERQQYLMKAAELLIQRGDIELAEDQLSNLGEEELAQSRQYDIQILAARIALKNDNPLEAMLLLPETFVLSPAQIIDAIQVEADANQQLGYHMRAANLRINIDDDIVDEQARESNHQGIWLALSSQPDLGNAADETADDTLKGWIELASIFRNARTGLSSLQDQVLDWGIRYPLHPVSNGFIESIIDQHLDNRPNISTIAVMLPLTGKLAAAGEAIRAGLMSAHFQQEASERPQQILFYDSGNPDTDFMSLYQRALDEGARTIIGPIDKIAINKLAQNLELDVPVLTLNYAENPAAQTTNLYQYGLLPEDEAEQVAELAIKDGLERAAVLVPDSEWGERMQRAFRTRFKQLGGAIISVQKYDQQKDDYSLPIRSMFDIDDSNTRHRVLQNVLDTKLKFEPHRREDVDMIFIAANSRSARGIMPAFKFHRAGDLPVYATSTVYTGRVDKIADRDLNGIVFCDLPWNLTTDNPLRASFESLWPEHRTLSRLFAMGIDAYHLAGNLTYLSNNDYARFQGETGNLHMDEYGRFRRELVWARFRNGTPSYIDTFTAPVEPVEEDDRDATDTEGNTDRTGLL